MPILLRIGVLPASACAIYRITPQIAYKEKFA
jgi:hypothetical protein